MDRQLLMAGLRVSLLLLARGFPLSSEETALPVTAQAKTLDSSTWAVLLNKGREAGIPMEGGYVFYVRPAIVSADKKILPSTVPHESEIASGLEAFACPGEYEPLTFAILSQKELQDVRIEASDLLTERGRIPSPNLDIRTVKCWYQAGPDYGRGSKTLTPELLLKDDRLVEADMASQTNALHFTDLPQDSAVLLPFSLAPNVSKQIWLTLRVPEETPPGTYLGTVTVRPANAAASQLALRVQVLPFRLERPMLDYGVFYSSVLVSPAPYYGGYPAIPATRLEAELRNMREHGIDYPAIYQGIINQPHTPNQPATEYNTKPLADFLEIMRKVGMPTDKLFYAGDFATIHYIVQAKTLPGEALDPEVKEVVRVAANAGISNVHFYLADEVWGETLAAERPLMEAIHKAGGKSWASILHVDYKLPAGLYSVVDLLDAANLHPAFLQHPEVLDRVHSYKFKAYIYANPHGGSEDPHIYRRNYGLFLWRSGLDGTLLFGYQDAASSPPWNEFSFNPNPPYSQLRGMMMVYPTVDGVIDTIQWEGLREGVDDIRYLTTLLRAIKEAKASASSIRREDATEAELWLRGVSIEGDLQALRWEMAQWMVKLRERAQ